MSKEAIISEFDKILERRGLSTLKRGKEEWGDRVYKHEHIQSMFDGYCIALTEQPSVDVDQIRLSITKTLNVLSAPELKCVECFCD